MAVAVVIDEAAAGAPLRPGHEEAGFAGDVGEGAVAVVAEQYVPVVVSEEDVFEAVVIVVGDGDARNPAGAREAGFRGHVGESAVAVVAIEAIAGAFGRGAEAGAAEREDIEPTVVVVIEKGDAAAYGFEDVALGIGVAVDSGGDEAGLTRNVGEPGVERQAGALAPGLRGHAAGSHALSEKALRQQGFEDDSSSVRVPQSLVSMVFHANRLPSS